MMKKIVFMLCAAASLVNAAPANNPSEGVDSKEQIVLHLLKMKRQCIADCSFAQNTAKEQQYLNSCYTWQDDRRTEWLARKYSALCQGKSFDEPFNFSPTHADLASEAFRTKQADQLMEKDPALLSCVRSKFMVYNNRWESVLRAGRPQKSRGRQNEMHGVNAWFRSIARLIGR